MLILRAICGEVRPLHELTGGVTRKLGEGALAVSERYSEKEKHREVGIEDCTCWW